MTYDELMRYKPAEQYQVDASIPQQGGVAQVPGLGVVTFMPDGRIVLNDPSSPSGETWLSRGQNGEVVQEQQAKNTDSALAGLAMPALVAFGGPLAGGALSGMMGSGATALETLGVGLPTELAGGSGVAGGLGAGAGLGITGGMSEGAGYAAGGDFLGSGINGVTGGLSEGAGYAAGGDFLGSGIDGITGGLSAGAGAAGGAAATAAAATGGASALSRIINGTANADDWLKVAGAVAPGLVGAYASNQQANAIKDLATQQKSQFDEFKGFGAPYRQRLSDLYANPNSFLTSNEVQSPVQLGSDILARSLSTGGNPIGSGNALQQLQSYSADQLFGRLGQEKDRLAGFGGLSAYNSAAAGGPQVQTNLNLAGLNSGANTWNALGSAANNIFNPPQTLAEQLAAFKRIVG